MQHDRDEHPIVRLGQGDYAREFNARDVRTGDHDVDLISPLLLIAFVALAVVLPLLSHLHSAGPRAPAGHPFAADPSSVAHADPERDGHSQSPTPPRGPRSGSSPEIGIRTH